MGKSKKKRVGLKLFIQVLVSAVFLLLIYRHLDYHAVFQTLKTVSFSTALLLTLLYTFGQVLSAFKWEVLVSNVGIHRSHREIIKAYFFGMFINNFGLGTLGGDVARSVALHPRKGERAASLATVVADRILGLTVLMAIGMASIIVVRPPHFGAISVVGAVLAFFALCFGWWAGPKLLTRIFPKGHSFGAMARQIANAFPHNPRPLFVATVISIFFHLTQIFMHIIIAKEIGANLSIGYLFAIVPLVNIACSLPISVNGLGIREAMYVLFFSPLQVPNETAVAFGAIWILIVTLVAAVGGLLVAPTTTLYVEEESLEEEIPTMEIGNEEEFERTVANKDF